MIFCPTLTYMYTLLEMGGYNVHVQHAVPFGVQIEGVGEIYTCTCRTLPTLLKTRLARHIEEEATCTCAIAV